VQAQHLYPADIGLLTDRVGGGKVVVEVKEGSVFKFR
jgi:hypothetical protein